MPKKYVGQSVKRTEDPRLIKGLAHYVDDIKLPDTLHVAFVRSVYAHARIKSINASEALKSPGVITVYTGKDVAKVGPVPCASALPDLRRPNRSTWPASRPTNSVAYSLSVTLRMSRGRTIAPDSHTPSISAAARSREILRFAQDDTLAAPRAQALDGNGWPTYARPAPHPVTAPRTP